MSPQVRWELWKITATEGPPPSRAEVRLFLRGEKKRRLKMKLMQRVTKYSALDDERQYIDESVNEFQDDGYGPGQKRPYASDKDIPDLAVEDEEEGEEES